MLSRGWRFVSVGGVARAANSPRPQRVSGGIGLRPHFRGSPAPCQISCSPAGAARAMVSFMFGLRQLRRSRRLRWVLSIGVAYALAIQALMASVGTGMSALRRPGKPALSFAVKSRRPGPDTPAIISTGFRAAVRSLYRRATAGTLRAGRRRPGLVPGLHQDGIGVCLGNGAIKPAASFRAFAAPPALRARRPSSPLHNARTRSVSAEPSFMRFRRTLCASYRNSSSSPR